MAVRLPGFAGLLSSFVNPGRSFADELSDRIAVVACVAKPNLLSDDLPSSRLGPETWERLRRISGAAPRDALLLIWGPAGDLPTALETLEERCQLAFAGVPNETRKALDNGTTIFERVLPGPDRMYPDTDSAPIPIHEADIQRIAAKCPSDITERMTRMDAWKVPSDCRTFLLKRNLFPVLEALIDDVGLDATLASTILGHTLRHASSGNPKDAHWVVGLSRAVIARGLHPEILQELVPVTYVAPSTTLDTLLTRIGYETASERTLVNNMAALSTEFSRRSSRTAADARMHWVVGQVRHKALGNVPMARAAELAEEVCAR